MKLLTFSIADHSELRLGIATSQGIIDVADTAAAHDLTAPNDVMEALDDGVKLLEKVAAVADAFLDKNKINFGPCVTHPEKIICIGLNYKRHAQETGMTLPETPVLFSKFNNALIGHGAEIPLSANAEQYDYEVELGVVIGRKARYVDESEALNHVFGYCTVNDLSVRDLQLRTSQWLLGKTMDGALPLGPYLVTADEVADPHNLRLTTRVNGELRQDSSTSDLAFNIPQLISYISQYFTLKPGDLICTGTPEGVALGMNPPPWLKPGDEVTVEIAGLGACTSYFVEE